MSIPQKSFEEQKEFICRNMQHLDHEDTLNIFNIFMAKEKKDLIQECTEGYMTDLDHMNDPDITQQVYNTIYTYLNKKDLKRLWDV